jgi:hypothetical protein
VTAKKEGMCKMRDARRKDYSISSAGEEAEEAEAAVVAEEEEAGQGADQRAPLVTGPEREAPDVPGASLEALLLRIMTGNPPPPFPPSLPLFCNILF